MKNARLSPNPVVFEELTCAFCRGRGRDPFDIMSSLSICCVCGGSGKVLVQAPAVACAHCRGTGAVKTLTCTTCGGRGFIPHPVSPTVSCSLCKGSGDDASAPAMGCLKCRGTGWMMEQDMNFTCNETNRHSCGSRNPVLSKPSGFPPSRE